jgi:exodeoxyribonuclease VII large subunit
VRGDLLQQLRELEHRASRCAARKLERAAEQLDATARRLPAREALLAPQTQRLDELSERLPRALRARLDRARADLGHSAGALRPSLLQHQHRRASERLAAVRLRPQPVLRRIEDGRRVLADLWRIAELAHPLQPLSKGYVRVEDRDGKTLVSADAARAAGKLRLQFGDGQVDVSVGDGVERPRRAAYIAPNMQQPKLF